VGGFLLYKTVDPGLDVNAARWVFERKGFGAPESFELNGYTLLLWRKQLISQPNFVRLSDGAGVFAVGSPYMPGSVYEEALRSLLAGRPSEVDGIRELRGPFAVLVSSADGLQLYTDPSGLYPVFRLSPSGAISSSFLALAFSSPKLTLDRDSLLEQLLIGFPSGGSTPFNEIQMLSGVRMQLKSGPAITEEVGKPESFPIHPVAPAEVGIRTILVRLVNEYWGLRKIADEFGLLLGLSGGYDSRLNLSLCLTASLRVLAYTYSSDRHTLEQQIAEQLATEVNAELFTINVKSNVRKSSEEIERGLDDSLFFYDGRTNRSMGSYDDVHTRAKRLTVYRLRRFELSGLGGELFRNRESYRGWMRLNGWLDSYVLGPESIGALDTRRRDVKEFRQRLLRKYASLLQVEFSKKITLRDARRYYRDVWLRYGAAAKTSAENQLAFFVLPFADWRTTESALAATDHIGCGGEFESRLIAALAPELARMPSTYGYPLNAPASGREVRSVLVNLLSARARYHLRRYTGRGRGESKELETVLKSRVCREALETLGSLDLPVNLGRFIESDENLRRAVFIGYLLTRLGSRIQGG